MIARPRYTGSRTVPGHSPSRPSNRDDHPPRMLLIAGDLSRRTMIDVIHPTTLAKPGNTKKDFVR